MSEAARQPSPPSPVLPYELPEELLIDGQVARRLIVEFIRSHMRQTGFERAVLSLSGGIDSALVAYLVAEAIGAVLVDRDRGVWRLTIGATNSSPVTVADAKGVLILLAGGPGFVDLDAQGCAQRLKGNSLVRFQPIFQREGFATALVDAPSDYQGPDGLSDFRAKDGHAQDLGKVIADLRARKIIGERPTFM